jgi:hypothetical protein
MLQPAASLEDVYKTISPEPLVDPEQLRAFYRGEVNKVRGDDKVVRLALALNRAYGGSYYKAFLMGHPGVGKSTELTRLAQQVQDKYRPIRFSATTELDPANFRPFDVVLLMMAEIAERTAKPVPEGGAGRKPSDTRLEEIWGWFATETETRTQASQIAAQVAAGAGVTAESWWAKILGLFASVKGEMKYAADRKKEIIEYRLSRLSTLISLANRLLDECNQLSREATSKECLFIGEDFDKPGIPVTQVEGLFLTYANVFKELRTHLIFTIPIGLGYSEQSVQLPFPGDRIFSIPDTPVFRPDHTPHVEGRDAACRVLEARITPDLFEQGQIIRLIVASGGNLRDLFSLVTQAADNAILRKSPNGRIGGSDADAAVSNLRTEYVRRLGRSPFDRQEIAYDEKARRLVQIYNSDPNAIIPDAVLYSLLRSRAVQEFDGERWYGVHPLVVDILRAQDRIQRDAPGGTE